MINIIQDLDYSYFDYSDVKILELKSQTFMDSHELLIHFP